MASRAREYWYHFARDGNPGCSISTVSGDLLHAAEKLACFNARSRRTCTNRLAIK
jgi:hypothetical protein